MMKEETDKQLSSLAWTTSLLKLLLNYSQCYLYQTHLNKPQFLGVHIQIFMNTIYVLSWALGKLTVLTCFFSDLTHIQPSINAESVNRLSIRHIHTTVKVCEILI